MSIFGKILEKLGMRKAEAAPSPSGPPSAMPRPGTSPAASPTGTPPPTAISEVDVARQLEEKASKNAQKLNWRSSIVDLLKLLDIDSSLESRKELAKELGAPADVMGGDSAKMNIWLHKEVLKKLAANGGKVPQDLLD